MTLFESWSGTWIFYAYRVPGEEDFINFHWSESNQIWYAASLHHSLGLFLDLFQNIDFFKTYDTYWKLIWYLDILRIWGTWRRRFHQLPLVGIEPNSVCSFLTSFPRTVFGFFRKYWIFQNLWHFLKADLGLRYFTHMGYLAKAISSTSIGRNRTKFGMQLPYIIP